MMMMMVCYDVMCI